MAFGIIVGVPLGILAALNHAKPIDEAALVVAMTGVSMPVFWLGLVAMLVFYAHLGIAPAPGRLTATITPPPFATGFLLVDALRAHRLDVVADWSRHLVLPAAVLSLYGLSRITRVMRGSMLETLDEDYVRTARAKGLRRRSVIMRHAARNSSGPIAPRSNGATVIPSGRRANSRSSLVLRRCSGRWRRSSPAMAKTSKA